MSLLGQKAEDVTVLTVSEEDDGADPETLKLLKGLRHACSCWQEGFLVEQHSVRRRQSISASQSPSLQGGIRKESS